MADTNKGRAGKYQVSLLLDCDDRLLLQTAADCSGLSRAQLLRKALREYLRRRSELHLKVKRAMGQVVDLAEPEDE